MPRYQCDLSPRQLEVGRLICEGHTSPQIAQQLQLSPSTVRAHRVTIRHKLQARNTSALMAAMLRRNLWSPS